MQRIISRQLPALTAGLFVGIVLQEILLSIVDLLNPDMHLNLALTGAVLEGGWMIPVFVCWWIGGFSAGLMSSMISQNLTIGCIAGALLMLPALTLAQYAFDSAQLAALFTINPLMAAAVGAWLAGRITLAAEE